MKRVWHNKALVKGPITLSPQNRGLCLGDGLFETLAVNGGVALWRFEHLERMARAAAELGIAFPETEIEDAIDALTHKTKDHHVIRLTLTRGEVERGLAGSGGKPCLLGTLVPFDAKLRFQAVSLATSTVRRNLHSPSSRLKTLSYIDNILAAREAVGLQADDALMLNSAGRVACSSIGNVFLEMDGELVTPSLSEGILPGVMRQTIVQLAKAAGMTVREKQVKTSDLVKADFMFVSNSLRFVRPVTKLDGKRFTARSKVIDLLMRALLNMEQEQIVLN